MAQLFIFFPFENVGLKKILNIKSASVHTRNISKHGHIKYQFDKTVNVFIITRYSVKMNKQNQQTNFGKTR